MTIDLTTLDAHEQPSDELKGKWKQYSRTDHAEFIRHPDIDELHAHQDGTHFKLAGHIPHDRILDSFREFGVPHWQPDEPIQDAPIYFHPLLPGLLIVPSLLPPDIQKFLLSRMIHRDLSNPAHMTNLHLHYELPYREGAGAEDRSFFSYPAEETAPRFLPKDPAVHKPLSVKQVLQRRLSWVTLGGQYDWTNREYPDQPPPAFPRDIAGLLHALFPDTLAQAAIVNFYTPGDTMMLHRDVSERTDKGLVSLSIGCEALFMVAPSAPGGGPANSPEEGAVWKEDGEGKEKGEEKAEEDQKPYVLLRLKSGDAIYMTGESRYAWHGVPKVLKNTCPDYLADWPAGEGGAYEQWRGWMRNKRINLNVRQMDDRES